MVDAEHTPAAGILHAAVDRLVTALSVDDDGELIGSDDEIDAALDGARAQAATYRLLPAPERTEAADVLGEALDALLCWEEQSEVEREDFGTLLRALEMARYQYGGASKLM